MADEAVSVGEKLVQDYPASAEFRRELANAIILKSMVALGPDPTPQSAAQALPIYHRALQLNASVLEDLKSNRPEALQPERPKGDQGRMFAASRMWAAYDLALHSHVTASLYRVQSDWHRAAEMDDQATTGFKELVERNPTVAYFQRWLVSALERRVDAARHDNDRDRAAAWSADAVAFWKRQLELHPNVPAFKTYADEAMKRDAELAKWLALPASMKETLPKTP